MAPASANATSCRGVANPSAVVERVQLAQTHLMETSNPFFHLSASRATLVRAQVTGSGAAPAVWVQASANGTYLGRICLSGPTSLPTSTASSTPSLATSYTGTLPAAWIRPGLTLSVQAGQSVKTLSAATLKVGAAPVLTFVTMDWMLFGDTVPLSLPSTFGSEYASRLPLTAIQHSVFPVQVPTSNLPIAPRADGLTANGATVTLPAQIATGKPHCSNADKMAGTCTPWSGYGVLDAVRSMTYTIQVANGMDRYSHWYGALSANQSVGGGLGGGVVGSGDDYKLTFNHEHGHAFDMPHWGDSLYARAATTATQMHPYTGQFLNASGQPLGGGFGDTWAYDPMVPAGPFMSPVCTSGSNAGKERQEPMQRNGTPCLPAGITFDYYSDYSALFVHRYFVGSAASYGGTTSSPRDQYGNQTPSFLMPAKSGRPNMVLQSSGDPKIMRWNESTKAYAEITPSSYSSTESRIYGELLPLQWNVPVYTLWGSFSTTTPVATTIQQPLKYNGNLKRVWDPTNASDFAAMKTFISGDGFWWGADLVARADFSDGTYSHALVKGSRRGADPLDGGTSFMFWAVNIPVQTGKTLTKVSLYYRPMEVRYGDGGKSTSSYYTSTNLNSTLNALLTADHYLDNATLVATRTVSGL